MEPEERKVVFETDNLMAQQSERPKDENRANYVLIGFVVLAIVVSLFLIFGSGGTAGSPEDIKILPAVF